MTDEEFLAAFEAQRITKAEWTRAAHIRMAWLYLRHLPFEEALKRMRKGIQRHNAGVGTPPTAYHETITVAFARLIHHRLRSAPPGQNFPAFHHQNPDLFTNYKTVLGRHYSPEHLGSDDARQWFVPPDREPLPE
jgi:hypothetical protein